MGNLIKHHKNERKNSKLESPLDKIQINLEKVKCKYQPSDFAERSVFLAMKSPTSYAIGEHINDLMVVENLTEIKHDGISEGSGSIKGILYIDHLGCYLVHHTGRIDRKDIDINPPYPYMSLRSPYRSGGRLRYSKRNKKLIVLDKENGLSVIDLGRKRVEMKVETRFLSSIHDFRIFGPKENKIVSISQESEICFYVISYGLKKTLSTVRQRFELGDDLSHHVPISLAASDQGKYIAVSMTDLHTFKSSRLILFEVVKGRSLVKIATLNEESQRMSSKYAFEFWRRIGSHLLWVGLTIEDGYLQLFDYDIESGRLGEVVKKKARHLHRERDPFYIQRLGGKLYYTGKLGSIWAISLNNSLIA